MAVLADLLVPLMVVLAERVAQVHQVAVAVAAVHLIMALVV